MSVKLRFYECLRSCVVRPESDNDKLDIVHLVFAEKNKKNLICFTYFLVDSKQYILE